MTPEQRREFQHGNTIKLRDLRRRIGGNIYGWRARRRLTLEVLARRTGLSVATIDRLEIGRGDIGLDHMLRLSIALGIGVEELVRERCEV